MRNRPLHALPSASLPRITRLSHNSLPTVEARPRRTRGSEKKKKIIYIDGGKPRDKHVTVSESPRCH